MPSSGLPSDTTQSWLAVDEAQRLICQTLQPTAAEPVALLDAVGRVLAEAVTATLPQPAFTNAAMDGFALRSLDTEQAPVTLAVDGVNAAGSPPGPPLAPGAARRIMTGAPLPAAADAVVAVEETEPLADARVRICGAVTRGRHIRQAGEDVAVGAQLLAAGHRLHALDVAALASQGMAVVSARCRPRVGILATGDEVQRPGQPLAAGQIYDCNSIALAALVTAFGGIPVPLGIARDREAELRQKLNEARCARLDLLLTSAGVSVGEYDLVKQLLQAMGTIDFWRVRIKPGKPLAFGHLHGSPGLPLIGLPGNPVAALVAALVFVRSALQALSGEPIHPPAQVQARLATPLRSGGRRHFVPARLLLQEQGLVAFTEGFGGSANAAGLLQADGLVVLPESAQEVAAGTLVTVWLLRG